MPQIGGPIQTSVHSGTLLLAVQDKEKLSGGKVIITNILIESFFHVFLFLSNRTQLQQAIPTTTYIVALLFVIQSILPH